MLPVAVVVIDARDVDVERTLCKVADAVLVVVAGQGLGHPEHGIGPVDDAENHIDDEQSQRSLDVGQSRRPDGQRSGDAQHTADDIHRQILLRPRLTALRRLCRKGQRLADEVFGLLAGEAPLLLYPASLQKLGHRHVQLLGQRHQQRDVRHTQSPFPLADGLVGHVQRRGKLLLGHPLFSAQLCQKMAECGLVQFVHIFCLLAGVCRPFSGLIIPGRILPRNRRAVESSSLRFFYEKAPHSFPCGASPFYIDRPKGRATR